MRVMNFLKFCFQSRTCESSASTAPEPSLSHCCTSQLHTASKRDPILPLSPGNQTSACSGRRAHLLRRCPAWPSPAHLAFLPELQLHFQGQLSSNSLLYKQCHILIKAIVQGELLQYVISVCSCTYRWPTF